MNLEAENTDFVRSKMDRIVPLSGRNVPDTPLLSYYPAEMYQIRHSYPIIRQKWTGYATLILLSGRNGPDTRLLSNYPARTRNTCPLNPDKLVTVTLLPFVYRAPISYPQAHV